MAAPTLVASAFAQASANTVTTASVAAQNGDTLIWCAIGAGASPGNSFVAPTSTITHGTVTQQSLHASASDCAVGCWTSPVTASVSGTMTATQTTSIVDPCTLMGFVARGVTGIGAVVATSVNTARTISLAAAQADSLIIWFCGDWNADAATGQTPTSSSHSTSSPGPTALPKNAQIAGQFTYYYGVLDDQPSTSAVSYGITGTGAGPFQLIGIELKGSSSGSSLSGSPSDSVGITDSVSASLAGSGSASPADPVGITDTATPTQALVRTVADPVGITDTGVTQTIEASVTLPDPVGITDSTSQVISATRSQGDPVGITDSVTASLGGGGSLTGTPADPEGIADAATTALAAVRTDDDPLGITDAVTAVLARVVTVADFLGITDTSSSSAQSASSQTLNDPAGITDTTATVSALVRPIAEPVGISDSAVAVLARTLTVTVADTVGITDQAVTGQRDITITGTLAPPRIGGRLLDPRITGQLED